MRQWYIYKVEMNGEEVWACSDGETIAESKVIGFGNTLDEARENYRKEFRS